MAGVLDNMIAADVIVMATPVYVTPGCTDENID
jgi:multimeric flavodoxin WrbA